MCQAKKYIRLLQTCILFSGIDPKSLRTRKKNTRDELLFNNELYHREIQSKKLFCQTHLSYTQNQQNIQHNNKLKLQPWDNSWRMSIYSGKKPWFLITKQNLISLIQCNRFQCNPSLPPFLPVRLDNHLYNIYSYQQKVAYHHKLKDVFGHVSPQTKRPPKCILPRQQLLIMSYKRICN